MRKSTLMSAVLGVSFLLSSASAWGEGPREAQFNLLLNPLGVIYAAGMEMGIGEKSSITARIGGISYYYEEDEYEEDGSGTLIGFGGRFYGDKVMSGMYFGAGFDFVDITVDWFDTGLYGTTEVTGIVPNIVLGYKNILNGNVTLEPNLFLGFLSVADTEDLDTTVIVGLGIAVGMRF